MINAFQIYYQESQPGGLIFTPYQNKELTPFFENQVFSDLHLNGDLCRGDLCGVLSWRFRSKVRVGNLVTMDGIQRYADQGARVLSFFPEYLKTRHNPFVSGNNWHRGLTPKFSDICLAILEKIGHKLDIGFIRTGAVVYSNYFLCAPEIMTEYMENWLLPAMDLMKNDEEIKQMVWQDAKYYRSKKADIRNILQKSIGIPYYPCHAFVLERFFTAFLQKNSTLPITHYSL